MTVINARIVGLAAAALLLAGCSGSDDNETTSAPDASPSSTATVDASAPDPTVGNQDDALCAAAQENLSQAADLESKTTDLTDLLQDTSFLLSDDATELNQWGTEMLELTSSTQEFYALGVTETAGEDVNADFVTLGTFVDSYSTALAQAAADAESPAAFLDKIQTLFTSEDATAAAQAAPAAAANVAAYLGTRCGLTT